MKPMGQLDFRTEFERTIQQTYPDGLDWGIVGVLTKAGDVYTLSYDSKILSGVFQIFCEPIVSQLARAHGLVMEKAAQNAYPDFTLFAESSPEHKIAVEVKSTYRQLDKSGRLRKFGFTLGSYRSFLRDPAGRRGILYPYGQYARHWVIGFLYTRNPDCRDTEIRSIIEAASLQSPYVDIEYFVQEKYRIAGHRPGSGNTTNIGSIRSNSIQDFRDGKGDFESHAEFEAYWRSYK